VADGGLACDDVEVVDDGDASEVEEVLAGAAVAGVGYPSDSAWITKSVRASSPYMGLSQAPIRPSRRRRSAGLTASPR
jgi:hypothetical protein